jgi:hypothetical protein
VGAAIAALSVVALLATPSALANPPVFDPYGNITAEATSASGAPVPFALPTASDETGPSSVSCDPGPGSVFGITTTTVNCTATNTTTLETSPMSFSVTVQDTTAPTIAGHPDVGPVPATGPGGAAVDYVPPNATDAVSGTFPASCTPGPGSTFGLGTSTVTCNASDGSGNPASPVTFSVTVADSGAPTIAQPPDINGVQATGPGGASVGYTPPNATDAIDGTFPASCSPGPGSTFGLGASTVTCNAADSSGNPASPVTFSVTVVDTAAPTIAAHADVSGVEATGPGGATVNYTPPNATDAVAGTFPATCAPASGATFAIGPTTVTCNANDGNGNSATPEAFTVTVVDTTPPAVATAPGIAREALSGAGANVNYATPAAVDIVDGPTAVTCSPASGGLFPLGGTTVTCSATDAHSNTGTSTFTIAVGDSTPPVLTVPAPITVSSSGKEKVPASNPAIAKFLAAATATDRVFGKTEVMNDAPALFPLGKTTITFETQDRYENRSYATSSVTVVEEAVAPSKPVDRTPPDNVRGLRITPGNHSLTLTWNRPNADDFDYVVILRALSQLDQAERPVFRSSQPTETTFTDRKLRNDVEYRYLVVSYDRTGNRSVGVAIVGVPRAPKLIRPAAAERVAEPPLLTWVPTPGADYYNVQLYRLIGPTKTVKVLSVWPQRARYQLAASWVYEKKRYVLVPGRYRWFVWPGRGPRKNSDYGTGLGQSLFVVVKRRT